MKIDYFLVTRNHISIIDNTKQKLFIPFMMKKRGFFIFTVGYEKFHIHGGRKICVCS